MSEAPSISHTSAASPTTTSLWHSGLHALAASLLSIVLGLALNIIVARAVGPAGKGDYDLILATAALLGMVLGFSLPSGVTYVVAQGRADPRLLRLPLAGIALGQGLAAALVLYALGFTDYASFLLPSSWGAWVILAIVLHVFFASWAGCLRAMLVGRQKIIQANQRELTSRAIHVFLLLAVAGVLMSSARPVTAKMLIAFSVAAALLSCLILFHAVRVMPSAAPSRSGFKEIVAYALPCYIGNLVQFLNYRLDVFFVSFFAGAAAVGLYTLAAALAQQIWLISAAAAMVLLPRVAAGQDAAAANAGKTAQATRLALWCSACAAMLLAVLAKPLVQKLFGEAFLPSLYALWWLLPGIVAFSIVNVIASYFAGMGKPRLNLLVALVGLFLTVLLDLMLIPRHRIIGAAIASTASYVSSAVLTLWLFQRESRLGLLQIVLPTRADVETLRALLRAVRGVPPASEAGAAANAHGNRRNSPPADEQKP